MTTIERNKVISDERLKQLMADVGMPNSRSLMQALTQVDMEATLAEREKWKDAVMYELDGNGQAKAIVFSVTGEVAE